MLFPKTFNSICLKPFTFSFSSCHLHLCEGVFSCFGRPRLRVLLLPAEAEHHLPRLSSRQPCSRPRDAADQHGEGVPNVRQGGADPEIRHHQQDQPSWRWVKPRLHGYITCRCQAFYYKPDGVQSLEMIFTVELINTTILTPLAELGLM